MRNCAVPGCTNSSYTLERWYKTECKQHRCRHSSPACACNAPFSLHPFPTYLRDPEGRMKWIKLINRKDILVVNEKTKSDSKIWTPARYSRVCSEHFVSGKPTTLHPYPSLKLGRKTSSEKKVRLSPKVIVVTPSESSSESPPIDDHPVETENDHETYIVKCKCVPDCSCSGCVILQKKLHQHQHETDRFMEQMQTIYSLTPMQRKHVTPLRFLKTDKSTRNYTGLPSKQAFRDLFRYVRKHSHKMRYWTGAPWRFVCSPQKSGWKNKLTQQQELLLVLMKLRQDLTNQMLSDIFGISTSSVSSIFHTWIKSMSRLLAPLIFWPDKITVQKMIPPSLKKQFPQLRCTIDCTEILIDRPHDPELQAQTWSDYKKQNTIKFLVGIAPNGHISFLSKAWGGGACDQMITQTSGFLDLIDPTDVIMADRDFPIQADLLVHHAKLFIPSPSSGIEQPCADVPKTKKITNARIHVERAVVRLKWFSILKHTLPISMVPLADDIVIVCAALCNLFHPVVL